MRFFIFISLSVLFFTELKAQNGSIKLFFEDNIGRIDSVILGLNDTSTIGIDTSFNEVDIYGTPFDSLDARVIQRDSISFNCNKSDWQDSLYFSNNIDSKIDYRPFLIDWGGAGFGVVNNNFEILINAVEYPVTVSADFSGILGSMLYGGWSKLYLLDDNCNDYDNKELAIYLQDSLFELPDSSFNTIVVRFQVHVGIEDYNHSKFNFQLFPNPSQNNVSLEFSDFITGEISVRNITGELISSEQLNNIKEHRINIATLSTGIYFIEVTDELGARSVKKLVVK